MNDFISPAAHSYRYKIDENTDETKASLLGSEFAQFVAYKALMGTEAQNKKGLHKGRNHAALSPVKQVDAFKPVFFMDPKFNPAISNTHICYEYDSHYKEMEKQWSRAGKKFSDEPRIGKPPSSDQGPTKQLEFPLLCEREKGVFGHTRKLRPFARAQQYTRPIDRCSFVYKPTKDDETSHLGPGVYVCPDPWTGKTGHGNVVGTHPLISTSPNVTTIPIDPDAPPLKVSLSHQQITGSPACRAKTPFKKPRASSTNVVPHRADDPQCQHQNSAISSRPRSSGLLVGTKIESSYADSLIHNDSRSASEVTDFLRSEVWGVREVWDTEVEPSHVRPVHSNKHSAPLSSHKKGFSFGKSTFSVSSLDLVTGTTDADLLYRRVRLDDGSPLIYATSKTTKELPPGSKETHSFGIDSLVVDASLSVTSGKCSAGSAQVYVLDQAHTANKPGSQSDQLDSMPPPVTFGKLHELSFDDSRVGTLPGTQSSPILAHPRNSPFKPPTVIKPRPNTGGGMNRSMSQSKRSKSSTSLSVRNSEVGAIMPGGSPYKAETETLGCGPKSGSCMEAVEGSLSSTESYRRLLKKTMEREIGRGGDTLGLKAKRVGPQRGHIASLVESLESHLAQ